MDGHISYASSFFDLFPLSGLPSLAKESNVTKIDIFLILKNVKEKK
jgi:hypothetical protein